MMKKEMFRDRLLQAIGLLILAVLTVAFILAFRKNLLPEQEEGDVFGTVFAMSANSEQNDSSEIDPEQGLSDLLSGMESETESQ